MEEFLKKLTEYYATDPTAPGIIIAWLLDRKQFYCSVQRFTERFGGGKLVVTKAMEPTFDGAVKKAMAIWEMMVKKIEEDRLKQADADKHEAEAVDG